MSGDDDVLGSEWRERGAVLLPGGAIVTKLTENAFGFRRRAYAALKRRAAKNEQGVAPAVARFDEAAFVEAYRGLPR